MLWSIHDILTATQGEALNPITIEGVESLVMDSREVKPLSLFLCMPGASVDGHTFINDALHRGASAILFSDPSFLPTHLSSDCVFIKVRDVPEALNNLAKFRRKQISAKVIAVTGSYGKTSVKEWIAGICRHFGKTHASNKSYNCFPGLPFTLANTPLDTKYAVIEVGMNHPGEIAPLAELTQPDIALITVVGRAHIAHLGSEENIVNEKTDIFKGLSKNGFAIYPSELRSFQILSAKLSHLPQDHQISFGEDGKSQLQLRQAEQIDGETSISLLLQGREFQFTIPLVGKHWTYNSMAVFACCVKAGISPEDVINPLTHFRGIPGRGLQHLVQLSTGGFIRVLNDCYNAGPESMRAAIETLAKTPLPCSGGRRIAVLGDMYEQGKNTIKIHQAVADELQKHKIDAVFASGEAMKDMFDALPSHMKQCHDPLFDTHALAEKVAQFVQSGDVILAKGSRGPYTFNSRGRMSVIIDALLALGTEVHDQTSQTQANMSKRHAL